MKADGAVLVVSATGTDSRSTRVAIDKLRSVASVNLLGVVLNQARAEEGQYSDYYLGSGKEIALASSAPKGAGPAPESPAATASGSNGVAPSDVPREATAG
jgi:Mrp family chromosome partitioning ATPase